MYRSWGIIAIALSLLVGAIAAVVYMNLHRSAEKRKIARMIYGNALVIDVRTPSEYSSGHYEDAINIPHNEIGERIDELGDFSTQIVLYCASGTRSASALNQLKRLGYYNVVNGISMKNLP